MLAFIDLGPTASVALKKILDDFGGQWPVGAAVPLANVKLLAPIPRPRKNIFGIGLNYVEHVAESSRALDTAKELPKQPVIFSKPPTSVIGPKVETALKKLGKVTRIGGDDPVTNAIAFARFSDGGFGWGVVEPGHGLVFTSQAADPQTAAAASPLSGTGTYGPLLLTSGADDIDKPLRDYLLDIQPGYAKDPVRGVYNHGWIVGDETAVSIAAQSKIDNLLEITPVTTKNQSG